MGEPHRCHCLETVDLDPAEVGVLLNLAGWEVEPGNRSPRGGTLREMHLHPLGVEVVAGLDAPPDDGEARVPRRRLQPERGVRMQELRLLAPGVDEVLEEAGRRIGVVPFRTLRTLRARTKPTRSRFGAEAGKRRRAVGRKRARRRVGRREEHRTGAGLGGDRRLRRGRSVRRRPRADRARSARQQAHEGERESAWWREPSQERGPRVHPIDPVPRASRPGLVRALVA